MGKKQREERKVGIQEARRLSTSSGNAALSNRPTDRVTIGQIVENHQDQTLEQHLPSPASTPSRAFFERIQSDLGAGPALDSSLLHLQDTRLERKSGSGGGGTSYDISGSPKDESDDKRKSKRWAYKNVYGLSVAYVVLFTAFIGLQNLQSSINSAGGLGLVTLSLLYAMFIAAGFVTPGFLKLFGTKYSLLFGFICHLIYTLANYYPSWYTLVPGSILIGFASAPIWAAASTHLAEVAVTVAPSLRKKQDYLISKFTGIFFFFFQFSQVPGNLASSLILFPYSEESVDINSVTNSNVLSVNLTNFEDGECNNLDSTSFDVKFLYILVSVYVGFIVTSIALLLIFVDRLPSNNRFFSTEKKFELYLKNPLIELLKVLKDVKMLLIAPMVVFNGMELAFAFGSFTEHYISQCFGTYQVGFTLIALGLSSSIMSIVYSRCLKYLPRFLVVLFGVTLSSAMLLFMLLWERVPSYYAIFAIALGWGAADAVWTTMPTSLTGILFAANSDVAYSAMRIWQAGGFTLGFAMAELFPFHVRLWVLLSTLVLAAVCNLILEFTTQSKEDLLPCVYCRRQHKSCEDDESKDIDTSSGSISSVVSGKDVTTECVTNELTQDHNGVGQNPIFIMYQGRRPSTMSVYSGSSLDDMYALPSTGDILPSGQNPMFLMHQGRRSSTVSAYSMDSLDGTVPLTSRRLSIDSLVRNGERKVSFTSPLSQDSLDGLPASLSSQSSSSQCYPPLTISTVVCANEDPVRALSPIRETEDDHEVEEPPLTTSESQRKVSIQRSDSYIAALNSVAANNLTEFSQC